MKVTFANSIQLEATDDDCLEPNLKSDREALKNFINQQVLLGKKPVSMCFLYGLYKLNPSDTRYRNKLKTRICNDLSECNGTRTHSHIL